MRHTCFPNVPPNHVIHLIGWFKLVINLRHQASLKPLFWPGQVGNIPPPPKKKNSFSVENLIIISLNTYCITNHCYCLAISLQKRIMYSHSALAAFSNVVFWVMQSAYRVLTQTSRQVDSLNIAPAQDNEFTRYVLHMWLKRIYEKRTCYFLFTRYADNTCAPDFPAIYRTCTSLLLILILLSINIFYFMYYIPLMLMPVLSERLDDFVCIIWSKMKLASET